MARESEVNEDSYRLTDFDGGDYHRCMDRLQDDFHVELERHMRESRRLLDVLAASQRLLCEGGSKVETGFTVSGSNSWDIEHSRTPIFETADPAKFQAVAFISAPNGEPLCLPPSSRSNLRRPTDGSQLGTRFASQTTGLGSITKTRTKETSKIVNFQVIDRLEELHKRLRTNALTGTTRFEHKILSLCDWWLTVEEPERTSRLADFVRGSQFSFLSSLVIVLNAMFMFYTTDYGITHLNEDETWFQVICEQVFLALFLAELLLRLSVHRLYYFCNRDCYWNVMDFLLVAAAIVGQVVGLCMGSGFGVGRNITLMRTVRVVKLVRTLRVLRLLSWASEPRRMMASIVGSMMCLLWSFFLMLFIFCLFSLILVQGLTSFFVEHYDDIDPEILDELLVEFGSVAATMLACYKMTTGGQDWTVYYEMIAHTGWMNVLLFLCFIMFSQVALMNILTGIFVENALKLAQPEYGDLALQKRRQNVKEAIQLAQLFHDFDMDKSGTISWEEFRDTVRSDRVRAQLEVLGLEIKDTEMFFHMLCQCTGEEEVDIDFFVDSCLKMKGFATGIDLQTLTFETRLMRLRMEEMMFQAGGSHPLRRVAPVAPMTSEVEQSASSQLLTPKGLTPLREDANNPKPFGAASKPLETTAEEDEELPVIVGRLRSRGIPAERVNGGFQHQSSEPAQPDVLG